MSLVRQPQVILTGELADFDVGSLLTAFGLGRQLVTLEILGEAGQRDGYIVIKAGRVVSAVAGEQTGAEAVRKLLSTERPAHFRVLRESQDAQLAVMHAEAAVGTIAELTKPTPVDLAAPVTESAELPLQAQAAGSPSSLTRRRSSRGGARVRVLEGTFADTPLPTLLNVVGAGRQYMELHILDERSVAVGVIELKSGMLVGARTGSLHGVDAARQLLNAPSHYRFAVIRRREAPRTLTVLARVSDLLVKTAKLPTVRSFDHAKELVVHAGRERPENIRTQPAHGVHGAHGAHGAHDAPRTRPAEDPLRTQPAHGARSSQPASDVAVPVMDGNLSELDLPSLMQVVGASRQHTKLRVFDDQRQLVGELHLKAGQVLQAEARGAAGITAVRRLLHSPRDFTFVVLRHPQAHELTTHDSLGSIQEVLARATAALGTSSGVFEALQLPAADGRPPTGRMLLSSTGAHEPLVLPLNGARSSWLTGAALGAGFVLIGGAAAALLLRPAQLTTDVSSARSAEQLERAPAPAHVVVPAPAAPSVVQPAAAASSQPGSAPAAEALAASLLGAPDVTGSALGKPAIASIQAGLRQLGYETGMIDGVLGPRTNAAVKAFQDDEGLVTDGRLTASTRARLARRISGE